MKTHTLIIVVTTFLLLFACANGVSESKGNEAEDISEIEPVLPASPEVEEVTKNDGNEAEDISEVESVLPASPEAEEVTKNDRVPDGNEAGDISEVEPVLPDSPETSEVKNDRVVNDTPLSEADFLEQLKELSDEDIFQQVAARVIESFPDTMLLNKRARVGVLLTSNIEDEFLKKIIANDPLFKKNPERVKAFIASGVGKIMTSQLIDVDDAFEIDPLFTQNQRFVDLDTGTPQRWEWYIKPIKTGKHILTYALERIEVVEGKERVITSIPVVENEVIVIVENNDTALGNTPTSQDEIKNKTGAWILPVTILGVALLGMLLFFLFRKNKAEKEISINLPSDEIRNLIAQSKTEKALKLLSNSVKELSRQKQNEITLLQSRWAAIESEINKGIIDSATADLKRNQIHDRILELLDDFSN